MTTLAAIIPLLLFLLLWGIFYKEQNEWRISFLSAAISWGVLLTGITEILSLFKAISFWPVLGAWSLCLIAAILGWIKIVGNPKELIKKFKLPGFSHFEFFLLGGIAFIAGIVALIAWIAPPNTWDSMTYHMARVMHWIQDGSVAYYPTHILRQLYLNPWSEFTILHFQVLSDSDRLANLVQWFSMVGSAVGVSLIAKQLGADRRGQVFSAVVSMTIPMGILQGSSTQNDYVVAFWLVCFIYWLLILKAKTDYWSALASGASLGLAVLTKGTTYIYAFPFLIWLSLSVIKTYRGKGIQLLSIVALTVLAINLGYFLRNYDLFSNPLGLMQENLVGHYTIEYKFSNDIFSIPEFMSNIVRNIAIHLGTPFDSVNLSLENGIDFFHQAIGISPDDPRTTLPLGTHFQIGNSSLLEDFAGNPLHVIIIIFITLLITFWRGNKGDTRSYFLCLLAAFLLFCFYLKWQPFGSRLQLPLFVTWSAIIGLILSDVRGKKLANSIMVLLLIASLPQVFLNSSRPLLGSQNIFNTNRTEQYFRNQRSLWFSYTRAVQLLPGPECKQIGLYLDLDSWEYPLWILLQQSIGKDVRIESVNVENISWRQYNRFPEFTPCAIIAANPLSASNFQVNGVKYSVYETTKFVTILTPK